MGLDDLVTQLLRFVSIANQVLNAHFLGICRAEVVPVKLGDIKKTSRLFLAGNCGLLLYLLFDFLTCEEFPLTLNQLVPLCLGQIVLTSRRHNHHLKLLSLFTRHLSCRFDFLLDRLLLLKQG